MRPDAGPSDRDRAHFQAIARAMAEKKRDQIERAARDTTAEGILVGLELGRLASDAPEIRALEEARAEGQIELRRRWLRLKRRPA